MRDCPRGDQVNSLRSMRAGCFCLPAGGRRLGHLACGQSEAAIEPAVGGPAGEAVVRPGLTGSCGTLGGQPQCRVAVSSCRAVICSCLPVIYMGSCMFCLCSCGCLVFFLFPALLVGLGCSVNRKFWGVSHARTWVNHLAQPDV